MNKKTKMIIRLAALLYCCVFALIFVLNGGKENQEVQGDDFSRVSINPVTTESYFSKFFKPKKNSESNTKNEDEDEKINNAKDDDFISVNPSRVSN